jgi:hypothetical protein
MIRKTLIAGAIAAPFLLIGCVSADSSSTKSASAQRGQVVKITPAIRAEIERQGFNPDEEICKREAQMGSTIPKRTCATRGAWEAKRQASREGLDDGQRRGLQAADPNAG